jgi:Tfp pilus assembly protein PilO
MVFHYSFFRSFYCKVLTSATLGVIVIVIGYAMDIRFLYKELEVKRKQYIILKEKIQDGQKKLELLLNQVPSKPIEKAQPPITEIETINILSAFEKEILAANVVGILFEPGIVEQNENFLIIPFKLAVEGKYKDLMIFINNIFRLPYVVVIDDVDLQKKKEEDDEYLKMQIMLSIYQNKKGGELRLENCAITQAKRDIFNPDTSKKDLLFWANRELKFLGLIKENKTILGVLSDPFGGIYKVKIGDHIGLNKSVVVAITEDGITTNKKEDDLVLIK